MQDLYNWKTKFTHCTYSLDLFNRLYQLDQASDTTIDFHTIKKAIYVARIYHGSQMRKSGEPFYSHPLAVAALTAENIFRTDPIVSSILHDTIEDTSLTREMIRDLFNPEVAEQVFDLTRVVRSDGTKMSAADIILSLVTQGKKDTAIIKICDRFHNLETIGSMPPAKIQKIIHETLGSFVIAAAYIEMPQLEKKFVELCKRAKLYLLSPEERAKISLKHSQNLLDLDNSQLLSLILQNV